MQDHHDITRNKLDLPTSSWIIPAVTLSALALALAAAWA